jgi:hypothetical protein
VADDEADSADNSKGQGIGKNFAVVDSSEGVESEGIKQGDTVVEVGNADARLDESSLHAVCLNSASHC